MLDVVVLINSEWGHAECDYADCGYSQRLFADPGLKEANTLAY